MYVMIHSAKEEKKKKEVGRMMKSTAFPGRRNSVSEWKMWYSIKTEILAGMQNGGEKIHLQILVVCDHHSTFGLNLFRKKQQSSS